MTGGVLKGIGDSADSMGSRVASAGKAMALGLAAGGAAAVGLGALSIKAASDQSESQNKVGVVFGDSAGDIEDFASRAAQALGQSKTEALASAGTFGNLFVSMGLGQGEAAGLSENILTLGADLGSFNNIAASDAMEKLRAGLVGEAEPLRALGVNMNAAMVEAKAMELGLADATGGISEAAKVQARYAIIMEQTKTAQGDFANTSTGMANATKIIQASFSDMQGQIGEQLLPVIAPLISAFAQGMPAAIETLKPILASVGEVIKKLAAGDFKGAFTDMLGIIGGVGGDMATKLQDWGRQLWAWIGPMIPPMLEEAGKLAGQLLTWIGDQVPGLVEKLLGWVNAAINWVVDAGVKITPKLLEFVGSVLDWVKAEAPGLVTRFIGEWVPAAIGWVAQAAIDILPKLLGLVGTIGTWVVTEGVPKLISIAVDMGKAIVTGFGNGMANLGSKLVEWVQNAIRSIHIDWGWIVIDGSTGVSFHIPTPEISNPFSGGGGGGEADASARYDAWVEGGRTDYNALNSYATGGIVTGPIGAPQLAIVHGGERVVANGGGGGNVNITVQGSVTSERDLVAAVRQGLLATQKRNLNLWGTAG